MKTTIKIATLALNIFFFLTPNQTKAQCHIDDWTALKALYESTNGDFWTNRSGWGTVLGDSPPANCNLENLYGITLDEAGRVFCIEFANGFGGGGCDSSTANNLVGNIPVEIGILSNLQNLIIDSGQLTGSIPSQIGNLGNLIRLRLPGNQLSGNIPAEIGNLNNLRYLNLASNQFEGIIPAELGNLSNLITLELYDNQLSGSIPSELGNLSKLTELKCDKNQLSGNIPSELGNLSNLTKLWLRSNQLSGNILSEFINLPNLIYLLLSNNQFSGNIPYELGNLNNLTWLEINDNNLSGCYPHSILPFCTQLTSQFFDGNSDISDGNNFNATWEDFCATEAGACIDDCETDCETNVYPGDLNNDGIVNNQDISLSGLFHYNSGPERTSEHQNTDWYAHPAENWNILNNQNKDIKHHDCNGDGVINEDDRQAVDDNMGQMWETPQDPTPPDESDYQVMLHPVDQIYDGYLVMNVSLERRAGGDLSLQGGHFTVDFGDIDGNITAATLNFEPTSWIGIPNLNLWYESTPFPSEKKIEVGFTKTNNANSEGSGKIGQLILDFNSNASRSVENADISYQFQVKTIGVHNSNGNFTPIENQQLQVNLNSTCQPNWTINEDIPFQNLYQSSGNITTNGFVLIGADQQVAYQANRITLNSGFSIKMGDSSRFKAGYGSCN